MKYFKNIVVFLTLIVRNFYIATILFLLLWLLLFDANDIVSQIRLHNKLEKMRSEKDYYIEKIAEVQLEKKQVMGNLPLVEKFAREKYLMRKANEDIYIIKKE